MKLKNKKKVGIEYYVLTKGLIPEEIKQRISCIHAEALIKSTKNNEKVNHSRV